MIDQAVYISELKRFKMHELKSVPTSLNPGDPILQHPSNGLENQASTSGPGPPVQEAVESLLYPATGTRRDLAFPLSRLKVFQKGDPTKQ